MNKYSSQLKKTAFYFFLFLIPGINSSFFLPPQNKLIIPKVNKDLSWIKQYTSIYNLFNQDQWEKNPTRSFDSLGVHLSKGGYHPVNASHYALYCYDEYIIGKNERFKKAFLAQVAYLRDCTKYNEIEGDKVGYPYLINFHDLKPPWYSSLAQGEAISVLIRYYALTKDESVLPLIVQVKNFMVNPMQKGGCLDTTPEGMVWLEEYPNSKQEAHNFSGYYIAVIALGEYSLLFPGDTATSNLYKIVLNNGKLNNKFYDSGSGIYYNRGDKRLCVAGYIKWLTNVMTHMAEFTGDDFFRFQHMIWSTYSYGKDYVDVGVKKDYYNWSVPIVKTAQNNFICSNPSEKAIAIATIKELKVENKVVYAGLVFDGNLKTSVKLTGSDTIVDPNTISITFLKEIESSHFEFNLQNDSLIHKLKINLFYKSGTDDNWKTFNNIKQEINEIETYKLKFEKTKFTKLKIIFNDNLKTSTIVRDIKITENIKIEEPEFMFYKTGAVPILNETSKLNCEFESGIKHWIFYRTANTTVALAASVFPAEKATSKNTLTLNTKDKFIEYLIMCEYQKSANGIKNLEIK